MRDIKFDPHESPLHSGGAVLRNILVLKACGRTREAPVLPCKMRSPPMALFASTPQITLSVG